MAYEITRRRFLRYCAAGIASFGLEGIANRVPLFAQDVSQAPVPRQRVYYDNILPTGELSGGVAELDMPKAAEFDRATVEAAASWPVTKIVDNGDSKNRLDMVILGDGFTKDEIGIYQKKVDRLLKDIFNEEPLKTYRNYFNVWRMDVVSNESGIDHPDLGIYKDTALDGSLNCGGIARLTCINRSKLEAAIDSLDSHSKDHVLVILNETMYGGAGGRNVAIIGAIEYPAIAAELAKHELVGHNIGKLGDEYDYGMPESVCLTGAEPVEPNLTRVTKRDGIKWNAGGGPPTGWIELHTPVPTITEDPDEVGLFTGGYYCLDHIFRPTMVSKMKAITDPGFPFGPVNTEAIVLGIYRYVSPIDTFSPLNDKTLTFTKGESQLFKISMPTPTSHSLQSEWYINGIMQNEGLEFLLDTTKLGVGLQTVEIKARDPTEFIRNDPENLSLERIVWKIDVMPTLTGPDLTGSWEYLNETSPRRPSIKGRFSVYNKGDQDSATSYVRFIDDTNTLLAQATVGALKPGKGRRVKLNVPLETGISYKGRKVTAVITSDSDINMANNSIQGSVQ